MQQATNSAQSTDSLATAAPIDIFGIIARWRSLHGYNKGDYDIYRHFCSRRIQHLRRLLPLTCRVKTISLQAQQPAPTSSKKNKSKVRTVTRLKLRVLPLVSDDAPINKVLKYGLLLSERSLAAIASVEKQIQEQKRQYNSYAKRYIICKLRSAINGFEELLRDTRVTASVNDESTTGILIRTLSCGLKGRLLYLSGKSEEALEQFLEGILLTRTDGVCRFLERDDSAEHGEFSLKKFHDYLVQWKFTITAENKIDRDALDAITKRTLDRLSQYGVAGDSLATAPGEMSFKVCTGTTVTIREEPIILKLKELDQIIMSISPNEEDEIADHLMRIKAEVETFISSCGLRNNSLQQIVSVLDLSYQSRSLSRLMRQLDHMIRLELDTFVTEICKQVIFLSDKNDSHLDQLAHFRPELGFKLAYDCVEILNRMSRCTFPNFTKSLAEAKNIVLNYKSIYSAILLLFGFQSDQAYTLARLAAQRETDFSSITHPQVMSQLLMPFNDVISILTGWEPIVKLQASRLEAICVTLCRLCEMQKENTSSPIHNNIPCKPFPPEPTLIPPNPIMYNLVDAVLNDQLLEQLMTVNVSTDDGTAGQNPGFITRLSSLWKR